MVCCCPRHFNPTRDWKQGAKGFLFAGLSCLRVKSFPQISSRFLLTSHWKVHRGAWGNLAKGNGVGIAPAGHIVSIDKIKILLGRKKWGMNGCWHTTNHTCRMLWNLKLFISLCEECIPETHSCVLPFVYHDGSPQLYCWINSGLLNGVKTT